LAVSFEFYVAFFIVACRLKVGALRDGLQVQYAWSLSLVGFMEGHGWQASTQRALL
jgi:hypothetical protein